MKIKWTAFINSISKNKFYYNIKCVINAFHLPRLPHSRPLIRYQWSQILRVHNLIWSTKLWLAKRECRPNRSAFTVSLHHTPTDVNVGCVCSNSLFPAEFRSRHFTVFTPQRLQPSAARHAKGGWLSINKTRHGAHYIAITLKHMPKQCMRQKSQNELSFLRPCVVAVVVEQEEKRQVVMSGTRGPRSQHTSVHIMHTPLTPPISGTELFTRTPPQKKQCRVRRAKPRIWNTRYIFNKKDGGEIDRQPATHISLN